MFERSVGFEDFNAAMRGAVYGDAPIFTNETFALHVRRHAIDLARSPCWQYEGALAGVALLAFRDERAWVGGFGVVPHLRGQGFARDLLRAISSICKDAKARSLELEVLAHNPAAIALYTGGGFEIVDELVSWSRTTPVRGADRYRVAAPDDHEHLLKRVARMPSACWQREPPSILATAPRELVIVGDPSQPAGYAVLHRTVSRSMLLDAGARDAASARLLLDALEQFEFKAPLTLVNEPAHGPLHEALSSSPAWNQTARQYRMRANLVPPSRT